jgi:hypothetical protein
LKTFSYSVVHSPGASWSMVEQIALAYDATQAPMAAEIERQRRAL